MFKYDGSNGLHLSYRFFVAAFVFAEIKCRPNVPKTPKSGEVIDR